ncbi:MAG TPA: HU family DNA-binding protein [Gemmataceae bacterium]|nr:HU family DNA-binding protein [Gemmataceae bacterium]
MAIAKKKTPARTTVVRAKASPRTVTRRSSTSRTTIQTVTLKQIGHELAEAYELPKRTVESLLNDMTDAIVKTIKKGAKVRISGIGILQVKKRAARMGRNPATGESIRIKASKKVALRVARDLKESL